jgi:hypothetical protein
MRIDRLTSKLQLALSDSQSLAVGLDHPAIEPAHLMQALLEQFRIGHGGGVEHHAAGGRGQGQHAEYHDHRNALTTGALPRLILAAVMVQSLATVILTVNVLILPTPESELVHWLPAPVAVQ